MKKLLCLTSTMVFAIAVFISGCSSDNEGNSTLATASKVSGAQNCYAPASEGSDFQGLNAMLVYYLAKNYKARQLAAINSQFYQSGSSANPPTDGDARSVWFDLETIKRFIYEIESQTCGKCGNNTKRLGIRIYYGAYPDSEAWSDPQWESSIGSLPVSYAGKHTIMMVPTYEDPATNAEIDFDPNYVSNGCDFTAIETFYNNMKTNPPTNITLTVLSGMTGTAQNHGQMIPPPYDNSLILDKGAGIMYAADQY